MSRPLGVRITLYLDEAYKNQSDRMWNNLIALDAMIVEEHVKAGVIIVEQVGSDVSRLEKVPGVVAVKVNEPDPPEQRLRAV